MKQINILVGGPKNLLPENWEQLQGEWIGVDFGALELIEAGIIPLVSVGDFDSVNKDEFQQIETHSGRIVKASSHKDDTDTELALTEALKFDSEAHIRVLGFSGGRLDHLLANVLMMLQERFKPYALKVELLDRFNQVQFFPAGEYDLQKVSDDYKYLAFVPLTEIDQLDLDDEKYPLHTKVLHARAYVSNEFIANTAHFRISNGLVAVIQSRD